ncbi:MAG: methyl-accepting chemotaxis protein [Desulfobulbaceae bacterium]|nr:methyl-accepting chemotaxis protein [Desulfobulbaceae bacterium]
MDWKTLNISQKVTIGFGCVLTFFICAGLFTFFGVNSIIDNAGMVISGNRLDSLVAQKEVDHLDWVAKVNALFTDSGVTTLEVQTDDHKCGFGKWLYGEERAKAEQQAPALAPLLKEIEKPHLALHRSAIAIGEAFRPADLQLYSFLQAKKIDHLQWMHKIKDAFLDPTVSSINVQMDPGQCGLGQWLHSEQANSLRTTNSEFTKLWQAIDAPHNALHESAAAVNALLAAGKRKDAISLYGTTTRNHAEQTLAALDTLLAWQDSQLQGLQAAKHIYTEQTIPALLAVQDILKKIRTTAKGTVITDEAMLTSATATKYAVVVVTVISIAVGMLLSYLIATGLTRGLGEISSTIQASATLVATAAKEIALGSQRLSDNVAQQAASAEESSATLADMTAMGKNTAELTADAEKLMNENIEKSGQSVRALVVLTNNLRQVEQDSDRIGQIITTIGSIAFQTNLLALNAAVEAARAGEAGAGFAVVADEVKNLASRTSEAAKTTQQLLEQTVARIIAGTKSLQDINNDFDGLIESATSIGEKTAAIANSTQKLALRIEQVSEAVNTSNEATQSIAATSEQSTAAAGELMAQAEELEHIVTDLIRIIHGRKHISKISLPATDSTPALSAPTPDA